jgi:predicted DNA-binding transcriptional regulator YafY
MHDQSPIHRHWLLLRTLSACRYGLTVRAMADEAGVGVKTIRRDLDLFCNLAFPLEETTSAFGRKTYRMTNPADVPPLSFRLDEALALDLSRPFLEPLAGTQFWEAAQSAFRKIRASLGEPELASAERMSCPFSRHPGRRQRVPTEDEAVRRLDAGHRELAGRPSPLPVGADRRAGVPRRVSPTFDNPSGVDVPGRPRPCSRADQAL